MSPKTPRTAHSPSVAIFRGTQVESLQSKWALNSSVHVTAFLYLLCDVFTDAVIGSYYTASNDWMMMMINWKGHGRKRLWRKLQYYPDYALQDGRPATQPPAQHKY